MEAKDTVMNLDAFNAWSKDWHLVNDVPELYMKADFLSRWELAKLQCQAEISFKAGQESRCDWHKPLPQIISESFSEGKLAGIKEAVEWVEGNIHLSYEHHVAFHIREWQAKLREWDIT